MERIDILERLQQKMAAAGNLRGGAFWFSWWVLVVEMGEK